MMTLDHLRSETRRWLGLAPPPRQVDVTTEHVAPQGAYERRRIVYTAPDGDRIPAFLLIPTGRQHPCPGVLIHHQHNGERHLGKSEVCGLAGKILGEAARAGRHGLQDLKEVWHYLARFGDRSAAGA